MAVVHCKEITGRGGEREMAGRRRYTRVFQLLTDSPHDGSKLVRDFVDLPAMGDAWEQLDADGNQTDLDIDVRLVMKRATQDDADNLQNWRVTCDYAGQGDPLNEPPVIDWSGARYQETSQRDINDRPFTNSAGDPFESGFTRDRSRLDLRIERNVLTFNPLEWLPFIDTLNELPFLEGRYPPGYGPRICKLSQVSARLMWAENYPNNLDPYYYRLNVLIEIDPRGWDVEMLDAGYRRLVDVGGGVFEPLQKIEHHGLAGHIMLLDGAGFELARGDDPVFLEPFVRYETADWSGLGLDF